MLKNPIIPRGYALLGQAVRVLACTVLCPLLACLDLAPLAVPSPDVNTAPVFLEDRVLPRPSRTPVVADIGEDCVQTRFSATLLDYDSDPVLYAKWIMQGVVRSGTEDIALPARQLKEEQVLATQVEVGTYLGADVPGAVIYRDVELELSREALFVAYDSPAALAEAGSSQLLELYVSDHRFGPGSTNVDPVASEGEPRPLVAYTSWLVDLVNTPNCGVAP